MFRDFMIGIIEDTKGISIPNRVAWNVADAVGIGGISTSGWVLNIAPKIAARQGIVTIKPRIMAGIT